MFGNLNENSNYPEKINDLKFQIEKLETQPGKIVNGQSCRNKEHMGGLNAQV